MPSFKFETPEEQNAFVRLLNLIPKKQGWDEIEDEGEYNETCHICGSNNNVKSGIVPVDDFFEPKRVERYTFWSCCRRCHNKEGWQVPQIVSTENMEYWRSSHTDHKAGRHIVKDFKIFKFPSVACINLDTVLVTI